MERLLTPLIVAIAFAAPLCMAAEDYPNKAIRFIVPFPAGGGTDGLARILGAKLTEYWGQQVIIDNRSGAQGSVGTAAGAKAAPDGYTITLARSIAAIRYCGHLSVVGNLAGKATIDPGALFAKRASMCGIQVGSRDMFEAMNRAIEVAKLEPVIDRVFDFTEARAAYEYLAGGKHFGKVVIRVS